MTISKVSEATLELTFDPDNGIGYEKLVKYFKKVTIKFKRKKW